MSSVERAREHFEQGTAHLRAGQYLAAEQCLRAALDLQPDRPSLLTNLALCLLHQRRGAEALDCARRATQVNPELAAAWFACAQIHLESAEPAAALQALERVAALQADGTESCYLRALAYAASNQHEAALAAFEATLARAPAHGLALMGAGTCLGTLGRHAAAVARFTQAMECGAPRAPLLLNRGISRVSLGHPGAALEDFAQGLLEAPEDAQLWFNRGVALMELGRADEALAAYERCLVLDPTEAKAWCNRGVIFKARHDLVAAIASYDQALALDPRYVQAWSNRGVALFELRRYDEALQCYARALALDPECADAHWNESHVRLLQGDFARGWPKYAYRWQCHSAPARAHERASLSSLAQIQPGCRILLWAEQGHGDALQFCRYAPRIAALGARVYLQVPAVLCELMATLPGCTVLDPQGAAPDFDFQAPLLDLPGLLESTTVFSWSGAYLSVSPAATARWSERIPRRSGRLRIGLACSGNPQHTNDRNRSMPLRIFSSLDAVADLFVLQKSLSDADRNCLATLPHTQFVGPELDTFMDAAAIASHMDLIISVDTALAHLAGALNLPVWILLPWAPEWRWQQERADSPWYPSARLFRQAAPGDWDGVLAAVVQCLETREPA